jgi:hypothetical protein
VMQHEPAQQQQHENVVNIAPPPGLTSLSDDPACIDDIRHKCPFPTNVKLTDLTVMECFLNSRVRFMERWFYFAIWTDGGSPSENCRRTGHKRVTDMP